MSWLSSMLGSDAAQTAQSKATAALKKAGSIYDVYGQPGIQRNWAISQGMLPWLSALSGGEYTPSTGTTATGGMGNPPQALMDVAGGGKGVIKYDPSTGSWVGHVSSDPAGKWATYDARTGTIRWNTWENPASWAKYEGYPTYTPDAYAGLDLGQLPDFMRVNVNQPFTPEELAAQRTLSGMGLSRYRAGLADTLASSMARRGLTGSSAEISGMGGVEDAYQRARAEEEAKLAQTVYEARQSARTEAGKNFWNVLSAIQQPTGAEDWARILSGQAEGMQGQANQAQAGYASNVGGLAELLTGLFGGA